MRRARTRGACSTARQGQPRAQASRRDDDRSPSEMSSIPSCALERGRVDDQYAKNGESTERPTANVNCRVIYNQSDTICCSSSKAFISSRRPVRALPASVFISASATGAIPSKSSKVVAEGRWCGSMMTCVTEAGANC